MVLNDRSLTNQKSGLSNSLNLTNQDSYVPRVDKKKKQTEKAIASLQVVPSPSRAHFDLPPSISTPCLALPRWLPGLKSANGILGYLSCILSDLASLFTLFHFFILSFFYPFS